MGRATMNSATPPAPDSFRVGGMLGVDALMLTSTIVVAVITLLSTFARRSGNHILRIFLTVLSQLYIPLVTYTISATGFIQAPSPLLIVSASLLQIIFKKSIPKKNIKIAVRKNHIDVSSDNAIEQLTDLGWLAFIILNDNGTVQNEFKIPASLVLLLTLAKVVQGNMASRLASRSFSVGRNTKLVASYMDQLESENEPEQVPKHLQSQLEFWSEYRYLVKGGEKQKRMLTATGYNISTDRADNVITVDKIWACEGTLLKNEERNREICLSFALCKLLLRKFEGLPLAESSSKRSLNLLLCGPFRNSQRAFRIIATELAFLNDFLYSPHPYTYYGWFPVLNIVLCLLFLACCFYLGVRIHEKLINHSSYLYGYYQSLGRDLRLEPQYDIALLYLDGIVCLVILSVTGWMEAWEVLTYLFSDHFKVVLLCKYVENYQKPLVCRTIQLLYTRLGILKPWPNKLSQYSICRGKIEKPIMVPEEVKKAIIKFLRNNRGKFSDGSGSLNCNHVSVPQALQACRLESHTERILVWHIATSWCEDRKSGFNSDECRAACSLSKYCAYLVVLVPELIPDYTAWTKFMSNGVIKELHCNDKRFSKRKWMNKSWCVRKMMDFEEGPSDRPGRVFGMGGELGELMMREISDEARRWEVLADLWAEMMLYVSMSSDNVEAHADKSGRGGEFITHVWALLSHIGINHRIQVEVRG